LCKDKQFFENARNIMLLFAPFCSF